MAQTVQKFDEFVRIFTTYFLQILYNRNLLQLNLFSNQVDGQAPYLSDSRHRDRPTSVRAREDRKTCSTFSLFLNAETATSTATTYAANAAYVTSKRKIR